MRYFCSICFFSLFFLWTRYRLIRFVDRSSRCREGVRGGCLATWRGKRETTTRRGCRHSTTGRPAESPSLLSPCISCLSSFNRARTLSLLCFYPHHRVRLPPRLVEELLYRDLPSLFSWRPMSRSAPCRISPWTLRFSAPRIFGWRTLGSDFG